MQIDRKILGYKKQSAKLGDALVTDDGYVFLIIKDDRNEKYRLLRLRDGDRDTRKVSIENNLVYSDHDTIDELLDHDDRRDRYTIIPREKLTLNIL